MKHIIALLLENEPGALSRVVGLFSARGYNIESLTVAPTEDPSLSRMTIVTTGSDEIIEQITKHLNRLIEVVKVVDLTEGNYTERELMLIKVRAVGKERDEMKRTADIFRGRIIDVTEKTYTIELTGDAGKLDAFIDAIDRAAILETVRTGRFVQYLLQDPDPAAIDSLRDMPGITDLEDQPVGLEEIYAALMGHPPEPEADADPQRNGEPEGVLP